MERTEAPLATRATLLAGNGALHECQHGHDEEQDDGRNCPCAPGVRGHAQHPARPGEEKHDVADLDVIQRGPLQLSGRDEQVDQGNCQEKLYPA